NAAIHCFLRGHMLDVLRVGYVVVPRDNAALNEACRSNANLALLKETVTKVVYRNLGPKEPAFFVPEIPPESALGSLAEMGQSKLAEIAYVANDYSGPLHFSASGAIHDFQEENGRISLRAQANGEQFLVIATTWYPHWHATIDGHDTALERVD